MDFPASWFAKPNLPPPPPGRRKRKAAKTAARVLRAARRRATASSFCPLPRPPASPPPPSPAARWESLFRLSCFSVGVDATWTPPVEGTSELPPGNQYPAVLADVQGPWCLSHPITGARTPVANIDKDQLTEVGSSTPRTIHATDRHWFAACLHTGPATALSISNVSICWSTGDLWTRPPAAGTPPDPAPKYRPPRRGPERRPPVPSPDFAQPCLPPLPRPCSPPRSMLSRCLTPARPATQDPLGFRPKPRAPPLGPPPLTPRHPMQPGHLLLPAGPPRALLAPPFLVPPARVGTLREALRQVAQHAHVLRFVTALAAAATSTGPTLQGK